MIEIPEHGYPLRWPVGVPRTISRRQSAFGASASDVGRELKRLYHELELAKAKGIILSSNIPPRHGYGETPKSGDVGVVAYWTIPVWRKNAWQRIPHCMPCDRWNRTVCNVHALALSIAAMRGMERWGAVTIEQAFSGFAALPPGSAPSGPVVIPWRDVIGGTWPDIDRDELFAIAKSRYRKAITEAHPDRGGSDERAVELNRAIAAAEAELTT